MSLDYLQKDIQIMDDYLKIPLLVSFKSEHFAFFNSVTQDITSIKQLAVYEAFEYERKIREHIIGILPVSQMLQTTLSAENIMKVLEEYFEGMGVTISNSCFSCRDTTNVNSGEKKKAGGGNLKLVGIMLKTSNLLRKYTHISSFRKYTF